MAAFALLAANSLVVKAETNSAGIQIVYANESVTIQFSTSSANYYSLMGGSNLTGVFSPLAMTLPSPQPDGLQEFTVPASTSEGYFRILATSLSQPGDADHDGIDDAYELQNATRLGLNPLDASDARRIGPFGISLLEQYKRESVGQTTDPGAQWPQLLAGPDYAFALLKDGSLVGWGANDKTQLGGGTNTTRYLPQAIGSGARWLTLSGQPFLRGPGGDNADSSLAGVQEDGKIWQWGTSGSSDQRQPAVKLKGTNWATVAVGPSHSMALKKDGSLWAWGNNRYGQLGIVTNGSARDRTNSIFLSLFSTATPTQVGTNKDWIVIGANGYVSAGIRQDGSLWMWGFNEAGELGQGDQRLQPEPVRVGQDSWAEVIIGSLPLQPYSARTNVTFVFGRKRDGSLWAWGDNRFGSLGDGSTQNRLAPVQIGARSDWAGVSTGLGASFAWNVWGDLYTWGTNAVGFTNLIDPTRIPLPARIAGLPPINAAVTESALVLVRTKSGQVLQWQPAYSTPVSDDNATNQPLGSPMMLEAPKNRLAAGDGHNLAIRADGSLWAWGRNEHGQLGIGGFDDQIAPVRVGTATNWIDVIAKADHSAALQADGTIWIWGDNELRQIDPDNADAIDHPSRASGLTGRFTHLAAGKLHTLARRTDGTAWMLGSAPSRAFATNSTAPYTGTPQFTVRQADPQTDWFELFAGSFGSMGLRSDGHSYAWGYLPNPSDIRQHGPLDYFNLSLVDGVFSSQLTPSGTASITIDSSFILSLDGSGKLWFAGEPNISSSIFAKSLPVIVDQSHHWVSIKTTLYEGVFGLTTDGTLFTSGYFSEGEGGTGELVSNVSFPEFVAVPATNHWVTFATGFRHLLAMDTQGDIYTWGQSPFGPISVRLVPSSLTNTWKQTSADRGGAGIATDGSLRRWDQGSPAGELVDARHSWQHVSGDATDLLALADDQTLWAFGNYPSDNLGIGHSVSPTNLTQVGLDHWKTAELGEFASIGIQTDGTLWAWGDSDVPRWLGTNAAVATPIQLGTDRDWASLSAGYTSLIAIKADGTIWGMGDDIWGQLGGTNTQSQTQFHRLNDGHWAAASAGSTHTAAIKEDGTLWIWGTPGAGFGFPRISPTQVGTNDNWIAVTAGSQFTAGLQKDGSLWIWGVLRPDDRTTYIETPLRVPGNIQWRTLSHCSSRALLLVTAEDGSLWGIGDQIDGEIGLGNPPVVSPRKVYFGE